MSPQDFVDLIQQTGVLLYVTIDQRIMALPGRYPTVILAEKLGKQVNGYSLGWDGCVALGMNTQDSKIVLQAMSTPRSVGGSINIRNQLMKLALRQK